MSGFVVLGFSVCLCLLKVSKGIDPCTATKDHTRDNVL